MKSLTYRWNADGREHALDLAHVGGTHGRRYPFGEPGTTRPVEVRDFFMATVPVTQALWSHVMGADAKPALRREPDRPLVDVSWDDLTRGGGFLDRINESAVRSAVASQAGAAGAFRLPSETEWEYAARGGSHWPDGFRFSGSNDVDAVAWYDRRHGDFTQPVGRKAPNQLGLYDMSGNVWEWCQDVFTAEIGLIPDDGSPFVGPGAERALRGGCYHNWAIHCTVSKRYAIGHEFHDGCIGFRLVYCGSPPPAAVGPRPAGAAGG